MVSRNVPAAVEEQVTGSTQERHHSAPVSLSTKVSADAHARLKIYAIKHQLKISDIIEQLINENCPEI